MKAPDLALRAADLHGLLRLGVDATHGITGVVEALHHAIVSRAGLVGPATSGRTRGITGLVYRSVRAGTRVVGRGIDAGFGAWVDARPASTRGSSAEREATLAVLNGLWGDHLADSGNPLAIAMSLRRGGQALDLEQGDLAAQLPQATGRVLVLVHGLCMNDLQWQRQGHDHGRMLQSAGGFTPLYLHYNSGRPVADNGRDFAALLERLLAQWPVPVREFAIIGHSMGGLVARSACHQAQGQPWLRALRSLVFLGTPHHGAPLERGGRVVDGLLGISPYAAPFARLGRTRSAGITDLRYGNMQHDDRAGADRNDPRHDDRRPTPLPDGVAAHVVGATLAARVDGARARLHDRFIGDGLVPLASALGEHADPQHRLGVPPARRRVVTGASHWDLLNRDEVSEQLREWLA
jgi:hypothetical protein